MSNPASHFSIPAGIVVERRSAASPWVDFTWRPVALLAGAPAATPWICLDDDGTTATFYAGAVSLDLYKTEAAHYRDNLTSPQPCAWVAISETGGTPPCVIAGATIDPAEGEALAEAGTVVVEAVPLPPAIVRQVAEFVARHPIQDNFVKRERDRADPEALARRLPADGTNNGRR